jgi:hypothetical protein
MFTTADIILVMIVVVGLLSFVSWIVLHRVYNKGVDAGRCQVIEEELYRMKRTPKSDLELKVTDFYEQFENAENFSRQACKYVEPDVTPTV